MTVFLLMNRMRMMMMRKKRKLRRRRSRWKMSQFIIESLYILDQLSPSGKMTDQARPVWVGRRRKHQTIIISRGGKTEKESIKKPWSCFPLISSVIKLIHSFSPKPNHAFFQVFESFSHFQPTCLSSFHEMRMGFNGVVFLFYF